MKLIALQDETEQGDMLRPSPGMIFSFKYKSNQNPKYLSYD